MAKMNVWKRMFPPRTHEGAVAQKVGAKAELRRSHVPLFRTRELARRKGSGPLVAETLEAVIQRADELGEFVSLYWKEKKQPLSAG
jgi:60 kDa SS-A/Ro ribonucleoprotein